MKSKVVRTFVALLIPGVFASATPCQAEDLYRKPQDKAHEIARLPKFCYAQYVDNSLKTSPEYSIVKACGVGMNHYCPALLMLMRAQSTTLTQPQRKVQLRGAKEQVNYTLQRMPPTCLYANDVHESMRQIQMLEKIYR